MSQESTDLDQVLDELNSLKMHHKTKMKWAYTSDEHSDHACRVDHLQSSINFINDMKKELDELREKAEAFDLIEKWVLDLQVHVVNLDETKIKISGDRIGISNNLLDCVKQARECEG